jgi:sortase A
MRNRAAGRFQSLGSMTTVASLVLLMAMPAMAQTVDTTHWSPSRIARFREVTKIKFDDEPIATLSIPRLSFEAAIFRGSDQLTLDRGLGWIPYTAEPGSSGNTGIAGHRDSFFRPLKDIALDDRIDLRTNGSVRTYVVRSLTVVSPKQVEVLAPTSDSVLTLVTCYPFFTQGEAPHRLIVRAMAEPDRAFAGAAPAAR